MKKTFYIFFFLFVFSTVVCYADTEIISEQIKEVASGQAKEETSRWTKADTLWQVSYSLLHSADWAQTRYVARHPQKFYEANPILGKHPSIGKVNLYFGATLVGHAAISYILPKPYRRYWQIFWMGVEVGCVTYNFSGGVKFDF